MDEATKQAVNSAARSILVVIGSTLVAKGYLTSGNWEIVLGAVTALIPIAWGVADKYLNERKVKAREATALNAGVAISNQEPGFTPPIPASHAQQVIKEFSTTERKSP